MKRQLLLLIIGASFVLLLISISFLIYLKRLHRSLSYIQTVERHVKEGNLDEAIVTLKGALKENPQNAEAHFALGILYNKKDILDDALSELETALAIKPDLINIYQEMYLVYRKKGMEGEARAAMDSYERLKGNK